MITVEEYVQVYEVTPSVMRTFGAICAERAIKKAEKDGYPVPRKLLDCVCVAFAYAAGLVCDEALVSARGRADSCQCDEAIRWVWHACRALCMVGTESGLEAAQAAARFIGMGSAEKEEEERIFQLDLLTAMNGDFDD